jgi:hypothetical protein
MFYLFLFTIWEICLIGAFVGGYAFGNKRKKKAEPRPLTTEEKRKAERRQKEDENFLTYNGTEQSL